MRGDRVTQRDEPGRYERMIWLYERDDEALRLETKFDNATGEFILIQQLPGDEQVIERFNSEEDFRTRLTALSTALDEARWHRTGPPLLLNDGWKI